MTAVLRRLLCNERGALIAEFAVALPVLLVLLLAGFEISRYALLHQKLDRLATTMADLVAQAETMTTEDIDLLFLASEHVAWPFDIKTQGVVIVSSIRAAPTPPSDPPGPPVVVWQRSGGGTLAETSKIGVVSGQAALPPGLTVDKGDTIIAAEVYFEYQPIFVPAIVPVSRLYHRAFYRPRLGALSTLG
ncbi:MAG TPA: TadE/TadG family type IV pilus assembly protein [Alphaproteobacteria bacterium]